jgi:hypothetical protein
MFHESNPFLALYQSDAAGSRAPSEHGPDQRGCAKKRRFAKAATSASFAR